MPVRVSPRFIRSSRTLRAEGVAQGADPKVRSRTAQATTQATDPARASVARDVAALALRRSDAREGSEPILTDAAVARIHDAFAHAAPRVRDKLGALVTSLAQPVARALLLKAIAARANQLSHDPAPRALAVLEKFAAALSGMTRTEMLTKATVLDLDGTTNTNTTDAQRLWNKRGNIHDDARGGDTDPTNDGLFQRFTASCGPTTLQMALAEADPVLAFALHAHDITSDATDDPVAKFQRALLESQGGVALDRRAAHLRSRYRNALARFGSLAEVRKRLDGFPTADELARIQREKWPERDEGISAEAMVNITNAHLTALTGVTYGVVEFGRSGSIRHLDEVARTLRRGIDVPFGISEPGHWMLMSAVQGRKPNREFLVSDPDGGRTAWVHERKLVRGSFAKVPFDLPKGDERPYVDSFLLPVKP